MGTSLVKLEMGAEHVGASLHFRGSKNISGWHEMVYQHTKMRYREMR